MTGVPPLPRWLGLAGLLPQWALLLALLIGPEEWRPVLLALGWAYGALIFSFLGGLWWGIAAARHGRGKAVPHWLWCVAVVPSLLALLTFLPQALTGEWSGTMLVTLGIFILVSLLIDRQMPRHGAPPWWMGLRVPLSLGLGAATVLLGLV